MSIRYDAIGYGELTPSHIKKATQKNVTGNGIRVVIHKAEYKYYRERLMPAIGFSGRAAYALGYDKPRYPVPAIPVSIVRGGNVIHWLTIVEHNKIDRVKHYWCAEEMLNELAWDTIRPYNHG